MSKARELAELAGTIDVTGDDVGFAGKVSRSVIPSWRVVRSSDQNETTAGTFVTVKFDNSSTDNCFLSGGCTLASGLITVPVTGLYSMSTVVRFDLVQATDLLVVKIIKNSEAAGAQENVAYLNEHSASNNSMSLNALYECTAGDTLKVQGYVQTDTSWHFSSNVCFFNGYMVG